MGGGTGLARPGEVSLANRGVLFLDEISLFRNEVLDSLRAPLEEGAVHLARSQGVVTYPANFSFVAATNPCQCGYAGHPKIACRCDPRQATAYESKLSGPLLDRIDMQIALKPLTKDQLLGTQQTEPSADIRSRVEKARLIQTARYGSARHTNACVSKRELDRGLDLNTAATDAIENYIEEMSLTGRGLTRVLRVARTIADLESRSCVDARDIASAINLRLIGYDKEYPNE
jgi:magnesium chelatase family protein